MITLQNASWFMSKYLGHSYLHLTTTLTPVGIGHSDVLAVDGSFIHYIEAKEEQRMAWLGLRGNY